MPRKSNIKKPTQPHKVPPPSNKSPPLKGTVMDGVVTPNNTVKGPSFLGTVMDGVVFGGGSAIGHRVIDGIMGPRKIEVESTSSNEKTNPDNSCKILLENYTKCLQTNNDPYQCQDFHEVMKKMNCLS